jgi:hypothetical protein
MLIIFIVIFKDYTEWNIPAPLKSSVAYPTLNIFQHLFSLIIHNS